MLIYSLFFFHIPQAKIQTIQGHARFTNDPEPTVEVNGKKYTAPHILIATGGQPSVLSDTEVPGKTKSLISVSYFHKMDVNYSKITY